MGGLKRSALLAGICQVWGVGLSMHSNSYLGVSLAAMVQLAASCENLTYACDTHYPWKNQDLVVPGALSFSGGSVVVPRTPDLGVELERHKLGCRTSSGGSVASASARTRRTCGV